MKFHGEGMEFEHAGPSRDEVFQRIARQLYYSIVCPFALESRSGAIGLRSLPSSSSIHGILKGLEIETLPGQQELDCARNEAIRDFITQFASPIRAIATNRRTPLATKNAPLVKPMFDRVSAAISETGAADARNAIADAKSTPEFWDWMQRQMIAMGESQGEGRGGR
jgi:hypothetical protein